MVNDGIRVANYKNTTDKRVDKLPIEALLQIVQQMLLLRIQEVAHIFHRMGRNGISRQKFSARRVHFICNQRIGAAEIVARVSRQPRRHAHCGALLVGRRPSVDNGWKVSGGWVVLVCKVGWGKNGGWWLVKICRTCMIHRAPLCQRVELR